MTPSRRCGLVRRTNLEHSRIGEKEFPHLWQVNRYAWWWRQSSSLPEESRKASKTKQIYLPSAVTVGRLSKFAFSVQREAVALRTAAEPHPALSCSLTFPVQACVGPPEPHTSCCSVACSGLPAQVHQGGPALQSFTQTDELHISNELLASQHVRQYADNVITLFHPS